MTRMKRWSVSIVMVWAFSGWPLSVLGQEFPQGEDPLIKPPVEAKEAKEAKIDSEFLEVGIFYGLYALEGFGASGVYGARLAYHLTEDIFFEGSLGLTQVDQETFQRLTGRPLVADEDIMYWNVDVGYNLFPGQIFVTRKHTLHSTIYFLAGVGETELDQRDHFTMNIGTGYKIFITDGLDIRMELKAHSFETDITGEKERIYNLEGTAALAIFF